MKPIPGICDRCSLRWPLSKLRYEYVLGRRTGSRVCPDCWDESHPQLDTRHIKTDDKQYVKDSRSDQPELLDSRALTGFNPSVGHPATSYNSCKVGTVTVSIA